MFLPPKQLDTDEKGRLLLKSFDHWEDIAYDVFDQNHFNKVYCLFNNATASYTIEDNRWVVGSRSGYEIFVVEKPADDFIWEGVLSVEGMGKLGLVTDMDEEGSGYYYSFDVVNGHIEVRAWGLTKQISGLISISRFCRITGSP